MPSTPERMDWCGLVHLFVDRPPDGNFGRIVSQHRAFVIPTLTVLESTIGVASAASLITDPNLAPFLPVTVASNLNRAFPVRLDSAKNYAAAEATVRQLKAARVPILAGSDAPNPGTAHGASLHRELELLVRAGLKPTEALAAATSVPAAQFNVADRGSIKPGLRADLLLVKGDPTTDIKATRNIVRIWKEGRAVDRNAYLAEVEKSKAEDARLRHASAPPGSESGLVSDFEEDRPKARFGFGWLVSSDKFLGGKSMAAMKIVEDGANGSRSSLLIEGEVAVGIPFGWAGVMFAPGPVPMTPVNLSAKKQVLFWARGDGNTYRVMLFAKSYGFLPAGCDFITGPEWKRYAFELSRFDGMDGHDLMGLAFASGPDLGKFAFQIDDVRFP